MQTIGAQGTLLQNDLAALQQQLDDLQRRPKAEASTDYVQTLPLASEADNVVQDIGQRAQANGVVVASLGIENREPTAAELGQMRVNVSAQAPYKASKNWLAELLAKHSSLAVASMAMTPVPNDTMRQDVRVSFVWYWRD